MTLRTSWFSAGLYKSTVRRFLWGSVLFFIMLFSVTVLPILFTVEPTDTFYYDVPLIFGSGFLAFPVFLSSIVPTIVALLAFRFVHSKRAGIFMHSLPQTRTASYISTLAAGFTLMLVPIILNAAVLALMPLCGYGAFFSIGDCAVWAGVCALAVFLMFSVATLAAFLTGNTFAAVCINGLLHLIAAILALSLSTLADTFLYGFSDMNGLINAVNEWNFVAYIISFTGRIISPEFSSGVSVLKAIIMPIIAIVLFALAYILYNKRRVETAEDVAAYRVCNPIYKYLLTFLVAIGIFGVFSFVLGEGYYFTLFYVLIGSFIAYFGTEMVLRKSFKIWRSWRGYAVFVAGFALLISVFAFTSFFGFEMRVPDAEDIESVSVSHSFSENLPYIENPEAIAYATALHESLVTDDKIFTLRTLPTERSGLLFIDYALKDGKTLLRKYYVTEQEQFDALDRMYAFPEYKKLAVEILSDDIATITSIDANYDIGYISDREIIDELAKCLRRDALALDYSETVGLGSNWGISMHISYTKTSDEKHYYDGARLNYMHIAVNANYKHTLAWLREHGYLERAFNPQNEDLTVLDHTQYTQWQNIEKEQKDADANVGYSYRPQVALREYLPLRFSEIDGARRITSDAEKAEIREIVQTTPVRYIPGKEYAYYVCSIREDGELNFLCALYDDADLRRFAGK